MLVVKPHHAFPFAMPFSNKAGSEVSSLTMKAVFYPLPSKFSFQRDGVFVILKRVGVFLFFVAFQRVSRFFLHPYK